MFDLRLALSVLLLASQIGTALGANQRPQVELMRVPNAGIQPQAVVARDGTVHVVYFKGDPAAGDLFYTASKNDEVFSPPIRVNSVAGSAIAIGNIRGARIAVGKNGTVHVVWNGSQRAADRAGRLSMLYTRLVPGEKSFEPERNLIQSAYGIDGGGGLAADEQGHVYVFWHAPIPGSNGEESRRVWITRSHDNGAHFEPEKIAWGEPTGACGCCSLDAFADPHGTVYVLFRAAHQVIHRDMYLLESTDHGASFRGSDVSRWDVGYCVMSSEAFAAGAGKVFAGWETENRVQFARVHYDDSRTMEPAVATTTGKQKYPSIAVNAKGFLLLAWTEGMGWKRGGSLHWQLLDPHGQRASKLGSQDGVPVWSLIATYAKPSGDFVILY